jgi:hypothetical protein
MLKNSKINFTCRSRRLISPHKFLTKKNILCDIGKKEKICPVNSHMFIYKFVFFIYDKKNVLSFWKFAYEHSMFGCTCKNFVPNFLILWNIFSDNGFICSHEPEWISVISGYMHAYMHVFGVFDVSEVIYEYMCIFNFEIQRIKGKLKNWKWSWAFAVCMHTAKDIWSHCYVHTHGKEDTWREPMHSCAGVVCIQRSLTCGLNDRRTTKGGGGAHGNAAQHGNATSHDNATSHGKVSQRTAKTSSTEKKQDTR